MNYEAESAYFNLLGPLLHRQPEKTVIAALAEDSPFSELPFAQDNKLALLGQAQMNAWLTSAPVDELTEQANIDYMRLLVGAGKVLAPPWGSVYLDEDRLLFNEDTLRVRQFYEHHGMMLKDKYKEPDDHIGLELEFIAYLLESGKFEEVRDFAATFVSPWVFQWNADVQKHAKTGFYKALGNMAAGGVEYFTGNISGSNLLLRTD
jgi:TorA maturation chaperone TorD